MDHNKDMKETIDKIAKWELDINTLETRNSDDLDFHDISVWQLKKALEEAFNSGRAWASAAIMSQCK